MRDERIEAAPEGAGRATPTVEPLISPRVYTILVSVSVAVLVTGLFLPDLVTEDSAQFAVMAMRMHYQDDWVNLVKGGGSYLDKPHLLFWSAMIGYRLFGVHDWSYRLVSVLVTLLGAWSTFGLGRRLHGDAVGKLAALMFLTSYAIVVGAHDVRMDALLTGFVAFGLWQLVRYLETDDWRSLVLGAVGIGLAFSAKGMIAVAVSGAAVLFLVWSRRSWRRLASWKTALGIAVFLATISPVVLCYYLQYDLHPDTIVDGRAGISGVRFILLGQTVDRFGGGAHGARHPDPLFFYHTLLWAFLPWSPLLFAGWLERLRRLLRHGWAAFHGQEQLSFLGPFVSIALLSLSRYKLAHYLNVFFPMLAIFTASYLAELRRAGRARSLDRLGNVQKAVVAVLVVGLLVVNVWAFPFRSGWVVAGALALGASLLLAFRLGDGLARVWVPPALAISLLSFVQSANYQRWMGDYQFGSRAAPRLLAHDLDWNRTYLVDKSFHPIQLYTRRLLHGIDVANLAAEAAGGKVFLLVGEEGRARVEETGLESRLRDRFDNCRVLKMTGRVLNPRTRNEACEPVYLLEVGG